MRRAPVAQKCKENREAGILCKEENRCRIDVAQGAPQRALCDDVRKEARDGGGKSEVSNQEAGGSLLEVRGRIPEV